MAASQLVLVTGGSGHLGFRVVAAALQSSYRVRAAVRSIEKAELIRAAKSVQGHLGQLEFVIVPDILADGAYDEAVRGVDYVLHVASPISFPTTEYERDLIEPAVKGTVGILKSAAAVDSVKRVVITSSEVAIIPWDDFVNVESDTIFTDEMSIPSPQPPYANPFEAYAASKVHALHATSRFMAGDGPGPSPSPSPHFDLINIMPSFIIGAHELAPSTAAMRSSGTNRHALTPLLGIKNPRANPSTTVFVDDVARIHVLALDAAIRGGQNFLVSSEGGAPGGRGTTWNDAVGVVRTWFPEAVARGVFPLGGDQPTKRTRVDSSRTEEVFGFALAGWETQVRSVAGQYLELWEREKKMEIQKEAEKEKEKA